MYITHVRRFCMCWIFEFSNITQYLLIFKQLSLPCWQFCTLKKIKINTEYSKVRKCDTYSLISMRMIYYFDTWAILWHGIACWFMVLPLFFPVLVCCDHKIVLHWYENQNKNNIVIMLRKSWEILGNIQKSTNNFMSNSG